jgi:hypothetical protein
MPTSNSYDWTSSRDSIISAAFRKIGALGDYETIDSTRLNIGIAALNPMIKALAAQGMPLWAISEKYIAMSNWASNPSVTIGPGATINQTDKPLKILQAVRRDNSVTSQPLDVPLEITTYEDYQALSSKKASGAPIKLFYLPGAYTGTISLWPMPDSFWQTNGQLYIRYHRQFQDFDSSSDEPDFPVEWHEALIYQLALRLAPEYGLSLNERMVLKKEADSILEAALSFGTEEGSLFIVPARRR